MKTLVVLLAALVAAILLCAIFTSTHPSASRQGHLLPFCFVSADPGNIPRSPVTMEVGLLVTGRDGICLALSIPLVRLPNSKTKEKAK